MSLRQSLTSAGTMLAIFLALTAAFHIFDQKAPVISIGDGVEAVTFVILYSAITWLWDRRRR